MNKETLAVLLVEDAPAYKLLLERLLDSPNMTTACAGDLQTGLQMIADDPPDIVLLDLGLPDCQGIETYHVLRDHSPEIPVVIISGLDDEDVAARAVQAGAQDYLVKGPYLTQGEAGKMLLTRAIRYAIERHHNQVDLRRERDSLETRVAERTASLEAVNIKLRWYYDRLNILRDIDRATLEAKSAREMASIALKQFGRLVAQNYADILIFTPVDLADTARGAAEPEHVMVIAKRTYGQARETGELISASALASDHSLHDGVPYLVSDLDGADSLSGYEERLRWLGVRSYLAIPLIAEGKLIGIINLGQDQPDRFSEDDIASAQQIAMPLALILRNAQLFEQIRSGQIRLQELARKLVSAQEEERQRLSLELHDDAGQAMTALQIKLKLIQNLLPSQPTKLRSQLADAIELTTETMDRIRALAHDLRPPSLDALGFDQAVNDLCQRMTHQSGAQVDYLGADLRELPDHYVISLYRVIQEALNNILKHAQASYATVTVQNDQGRVYLQVADNGVGFDSQGYFNGVPSGLGLQNIAERIEALGGSFELTAIPGRGTRLFVQAPWRQAL